jgi:predicted outer membrane lipoprotein
MRTLLQLLRTLLRAAAGVLNALAGLRPGIAAGFLIPNRQTPLAAPGARAAPWLEASDIFARFRLASFAHGPP